MTTDEELRQMMQAEYRRLLTLKHAADMLHCRMADLELRESVFGVHVVVCHDREVCPDDGTWYLLRGVYREEPDPWDRTPYLQSDGRPLTYTATFPAWFDPDTRKAWPVKPEDIE